MELLHFGQERREKNVFGNKQQRVCDVYNLRDNELQSDVSIYTRIY